MRSRHHQDDYNISTLHCKNSFPPPFLLSIMFNISRCWSARFYRGMSCGVRVRGSDIPFENKSIKSVLIKVWYQQNMFRAEKTSFSLFFFYENMKQQIVLDFSDFCFLHENIFNLFRISSSLTSSSTLWNFPRWWKFLLRM